MLFNSQKDDERSSDDFHRVCDGKTDTVCLALSGKNNHIVGGYASQTYDVVPDAENPWKEDANAFVFSLDRKEKYEVIDKEKALWNTVKNAAGFNNDF